MQGCVLLKKGIVVYLELWVKEENEDSTPKCIGPMRGTIEVHKSTELRYTSLLCSLRRLGSSYWQPFLASVNVCCEPQETCAETSAVVHVDTEGAVAAA